MSLNWYAIRTLPVRNAEFNVLHALHQRECPAMVPFEEKYERKAGRKKPVKRKYALFPRYVFAGFHGYQEFLVTKEFINSHAERMGKNPPILHVVGFGGRPATLAEREVSFLRELSIPSATQVNFHKALRSGSRINITSGPFSGLSGQVDDVSRKGRVKVMLDGFNSMQAVEMDMGSLEAA